MIPGTQMGNEESRVDAVDILLRDEQVKRLRSILHELANLFTGVLIAGGLLTHNLKGTSNSGYAEGICGLGERGSQLIREAREVLLGQSEVELPLQDATAHPIRGESEECNGRD